MKPESFLEIYPQEWLDLSVCERADRLWILNKKYMRDKALDMRNFLWNFTSSHRRLGVNRLGRLCSALGEREEGGQRAWTRREKRFLKDAVFSAYAVNKDDCANLLDEYTLMLYSAIKDIEEREDRGIFAEGILRRFTPPVIGTLIPRGNRRKDGDEEFYAGAREAVIEMFANLDDYANEVDRKIKAMKEARRKEFWDYSDFIILN